MLTAKNLIMKWKHCEVLEQDDLIKSKFDWQRIAILKYKNKIYYVVLNSDLSAKVVPIEELQWEYRDGKFYDKNDTEILFQKIVENLKNDKEIK